MTGGAAFDEAAARPADVLAFWRAAGTDKWFEKSAALDLEVRQRFFSLWHAARAENIFCHGLAHLFGAIGDRRHLGRGHQPALAADRSARRVE